MTETNISELICELNSRYCSKLNFFTSEKACWTKDFISRCSRVRYSWFIGVRAARFLKFMLSSEAMRFGVALRFAYCALPETASVFLKGM
jgi:hypothetical protein